LGYDTHTLAFPTQGGIFLSVVLGRWCQCHYSFWNPSTDKCESAYGVNKQNADQTGELLGLCFSKQWVKIKRHFVAISRVGFYNYFNKIVYNFSQHITHNNVSIAHSSFFTANSWSKQTLISTLCFWECKTFILFATWWRLTITLLTIHFYNANFQSQISISFHPKKSAHQVFHQSSIISLINFIKSSVNICISR